jgi:monoamine oxidase
LYEWGKDPFIRGGYTTLSINEGPDTRKELAKPVRDVLFFAGEATGSIYMTAHGAMGSGSRAAKEVLEVPRDKKSLETV